MDAPSQYELVREDQRSLALTARMEAAIEDLAAQLARGHTDGYLRFLAFYSRFWTYSIRNTMLIHDQCPGATRCAGMRLWNSLGYHVKKGERAIWLWAPVLAKRPDEETGELVEQVVGFVPAPVFDASQLVGIEERPFPQPFPVLPDDATEAYRLCVAKIRAQGITVAERDDLEPGVQGLSEPERISIRTGLDSRNRLFVLIHELVHQTWHHDAHDPLDSRQQFEFEAESVAFVVAALMGLEHPSAADYLLGYKVTPELLKRSLAVIQLEVRHLLSVLELPFDVLRQPEALIGAA